MIKEASIEIAITNIIDALGLDRNDPNLRDTPKRAARAYKEIFAGLEDTEAKANTILSRTFPSNNNQMVVVDNIKEYSMCPHHFLPVECTVHIGYVPNGTVIGLSKLARIAELYASQPILQEDLAEKIASSISDKLKPRGVMVVIVGKHFCMAMRGVHKREATTTTSYVEGCFRDPSEGSRDEFLRLIK